MLHTQPTIPSQQRIGLTFKVCVEENEAEFSLSNASHSTNKERKRGKSCRLKILLDVRVSTSD